MLIATHVVSDVECIAKEILFSARRKNLFGERDTGKVGGTNGWACFGK